MKDERNERDKRIDWFWFSLVNESSRMFVFPKSSLASLAHLLVMLSTLCSSVLLFLNHLCTKKYK